MLKWLRLDAPEIAIRLDSFLLRERLLIVDVDLAQKRQTVAIRSLISDPRRLTETD